jgi:hypothetical protein
VNNQNSNEHTGEMFHGSALRRTTPFQHFMVALIAGIVGMLAAKYYFHSNDGVGFMGCFGLMFYALFNPWLFMLAANSLKYFLTSLSLYITLTLLMFGVIYLFTGESIMNKWDLRIIIISATFFYFVAFGMMRLLKLILDTDDDKL